MDTNRSEIYNQVEASPELSLERAAFVGELDDIIGSTVRMGRIEHKETVLASVLSDSVLSAAVNVVDEYGLSPTDEARFTLQQLLKVAYAADQVGRFSSRLAYYWESSESDEPDAVGILESAQLIFARVGSSAEQHANHLEATVLGADVIKQILHQNPEAVRSPYAREKLGAVTSRLQRKHFLRYP